MALLSDGDFKIILGEDFKRKLSLGMAKETASAEEVRADRQNRLQKLNDARFSFGAVAFTGIALVLGAVYSGATLSSVQSGIGASGILIAVIGIAFVTMKHRAVSAEAGAAG